MRTRSHWAWGFEDALPDADARRALAAQVTFLLGGEALALRPLPHADRARMPEPRCHVPEALAPFANQMREDRILHAHGRGYPDIVRGFEGDFAHAPDVVAYPRDEEDLAALFEVCARESAALVPFGGGTSVVGGVTCASERPVVCVDMRAFCKVLEVDDVSLAARIQAGTSGPDLEAQLAARGLTLRFFPQSFELSTLGGWIATRAGGHFATGPTHIDNLTESVRMLTPSGVYETLRVPASGAGPDPNRLVLGSEGTLGVITEAWMRVFRRPLYRASANVLFGDLRAAVAAARAIVQARLLPSNCRVLDAREAMLNGVAGDGSCVLLLAFESADHDLREAMERALKLASREGGRCEKGARYRRGGEKARGGGGEGEAWRAAFLRGPYLQSALISMGLVIDTFETACTWDRFDALHAEVQGAVRAAFEAMGEQGMLSCRVTHLYPDGLAPYYTFAVRGAPGRELEQWDALKRAASDALSRAGATITHHHAVGRTHRPWYDRERPEPFAAALRAAKRALDPAGILNPGVLIDV